MKYFDGWATVILPVDVTVQQSGVLRTNSNKTPEKTHKYLSRNDIGIVIVVMSNYSIYFLGLIASCIHFI